MYQSHFNLTTEPFGVSPDGRFFCRTEQHSEALASLYYAVRQRRGFALLVGRAGLGKTSVLVQLIQMLEGKAEVAYLPHPFFDRTTVLDSILLALGLPAGATLAQSHRLFFDHLMKLRLAGKTCVVIFDEAQDLAPDTLEAIRMLSNFETPTEKLLQIVLSGQPKLAETLSHPESEQLRQRLNVIARLQPLDGPGVRTYMSHRLQVAGGSESLFTPAAIAAIVASSAGVPRNINTLCFNTLTLAFALNRRQAGLEEVEEVLRDLSLSEFLGDAAKAASAAGHAGTLGESRAAFLPETPAHAPGYSAKAESILSQPERSTHRRPALIAASVVLVAAGAFLFRTYHLLAL